MNNENMKRILCYITSLIRAIDHKYRIILDEKLKNNYSKYPIVEIICFCIVVDQIILNAWICDDAYHAFIMARNLVEGNGLVYNIGERVNASTCPFYTLLVAALYVIYKDMFMCGVFINVLCAAIAIAILIFKFCRGNRVLVILVTAIMYICEGFISYTTSGLENSLLFCLASIFCSVMFEKKEKKYNTRDLFFSALMVGLIAGTRMDTVLIFVPICIAVFFGGMNTDVNCYKRYIVGAAGLLPFVIWEMFSIYYYGFPFPNTAYAKLNTAIPLSDYLKRGFEYFKLSCKYDPIIILVPIFFVVIAFYCRSKKHIAVALGNVMYFIYIFYIGGDFMMDRHYTLVFFVSLLGCSNILAEGMIDVKLDKIYSIFYKLITGFIDVIWNTLFSPFDKENTKASPSFFYLLAVILTASLMIHWGNCFNQSHNGPTIGNGCVDSRERSRPYSSLMQYLMEGEESILKAFDYYEVTGNGGYLLFAPGFNLYYLRDGKNYFDEFGLGDAIIPRLKGRYNPSWRIGHVRRTLPKGYDETIKTGENNIEDVNLAEYYEKMKLVISGRLNDKERIKTIINFNLGKYDYLLERYNDNNANLEVYYPTTEKRWGW